MIDSIFTKIINNEIPCHKVYEDENTLTFMDINPIQPGQALVISKRQVSNFYELDDIEYQALMSTVKRVALQLKKLFPHKKRIGVIIEGLEVDHVHVKVFPIDSGADLRHEPDMRLEPDHEALAELAEKLAF